jgi:hypothetical protein
MNIIKEIKNILDNNNCHCFTLDEKEYKLVHNLSIDDARNNACNHRFFVEITGLLVKYNIDYTVTDEHHILIDKSSLESIS